MSTATTAAGLVGVDLAKNVFSMCEVDASCRVVRRQDLRREAFTLWLAQIPAGTVGTIAACSGAHQWARRCEEYGLNPLLIAAQFVNPFRKSSGAKKCQSRAAQ